MQRKTRGRVLSPPVATKKYLLFMCDMEHTGLFLSLIQRRKWPTIELTCFRGERPVSDELTAARAGRFSELLCPHLADCVRSAEFRTSVIHRHLAETGEMGIRLRVQAVMPCLLQGEFARGRRLASADYCRGQGWCSYCGGVGMEAGEFYQAAQVVIAIVAASRRPRCGERHARQLPAAANGSQQVQERHGAGPLTLTSARAPAAPCGLLTSRPSCG